jgi:NAD(P)-dependent dehydrogenase (short-subunit alcohol dehydrogenase family)
MAVFGAGRNPLAIRQIGGHHGATGSLGYEMALALAKVGAEVILTGRDDRKGQSAIEKIKREVSGARVSYESLDLANLASIADFSQRMHSRHSLDLLINNAGVMALPRRQTTSDGFEMQFGTTIWGTLFSRHG